MASRRVLIVANRTSGGRHLMDAVRARTSSGACSFTLLCPATPSPGGLVWEEREEKQGAAERLEVALRRLQAIGAEVAGRVGGHDPFQAVMDELRRQQYDEIIVSTYPQGFSAWLKLDLPSRIARAFPGPVEHVVSHE
jgi:nucleotide-binding universal stress UspA family protein